MLIKPKFGVNLRASTNEQNSQWLLMQNMDMTHDGNYTQIRGSRRYHGASLGTRAPTEIIPYYDNDRQIGHVLVGVGGSIWKKDEGSNEFTELLSNLTPNKLKFSVNIQNREWISHPDGMLVYDGIKKIESINDDPPKTKDIIFAKEINRCFALDSEIPNRFIWTDDLTTIGGAPVLWAALNTDILPPTDGGIIIKLGFLNGRLIFFMTNSTWIEYVNAQPENWRFEKSATQVGWIAPKTIKQVGAEYWGLGFSQRTGRGVYAFDGRTSRLLSYDVEPELNSINPSRITEASAEYVDNLYKLSYARGFATENDHTLHFDTINLNPETQSPNIYGPHKYGFNCAASLDTRNFKGQFLTGKLISSEARVFEEVDYRTFHATGMDDDGDLIQTILLSFIIDSIQIQSGQIDESWFKRFEYFRLNFPPSGTWPAFMQIFQKHLNESVINYNQFLEGGSRGLGAIDLGSDALNLDSFESLVIVQNVVSTGIQFKISNSTVNRTLAINSIGFDVEPVRKDKGVQRARIGV